MIVQFMVSNEPVTILEGVKDYELGKHHSTFVTSNGIVEMRTSSYHYITVQLEASDVEEEMASHTPKPAEKKIGFTHEESQGEPEEPEDDEYGRWMGGRKNG